MRHIAGKDYMKLPSALEKNLCFRQIHKACEEKDGNAYTGNYYGHPDVKSQLRALSVGLEATSQTDSAKCYYCESKIEHAAVLQVEHYRPKAKVAAEDTNNQAHPGYYWLGNEWSNLLLACPACNGRSAKGSRFPVAGVRAEEINPVTKSELDNKAEFQLDRTLLLADKPPLTDEKPLLINPETDFPENMLSFEPDGTLIGIDPENKGQTTINTLQLNRDKLVLNRQIILNGFIDNLMVAVYGCEIGKLSIDALDYIFDAQCRKIRESQNPSEEYSLFGKFINDNFERIIAKEIPEKYRNQLIEAYNNTCKTIDD